MALYKRITPTIIKGVFNKKSVKITEELEIKIIRIFWSKILEEKR